MNLLDHLAFGSKVPPMSPKSPQTHPNLSKCQRLGGKSTKKPPNYFNVQKRPKISNKASQTLQNRALGPPKSSLGASIIELGAVQDALFENT